MAAASLWGALQWAVNNAAGHPAAEDPAIASITPLGASTAVIDDAHCSMSECSASPPACNNALRAAVYELESSRDSSDSRVRTLTAVIAAAVAW